MLPCTSAYLLYSWRLVFHFCRQYAWAIILYSPLLFHRNNVLLYISPMSSIFLCCPWWHLLPLTLNSCCFLLDVDSSIFVYMWQLFLWWWRLVPYIFHPAIFSITLLYSHVIVLSICLYFNILLLTKMSDISLSFMAALLTTCFLWITPRMSAGYTPRPFHYIYELSQFLFCGCTVLAGLVPFSILLMSTFSFFLCALSLFIGTFNLPVSNAWSVLQSAPGLAFTDIDTFLNRLLTVV